MRTLANDIHDPHRNDNYLADGLATQRLFYRIKGQNGSLNLWILRIAGHCDLASFLAIDLDHQGHCVFDQQIAFDLGPSRIGHQAGLPQPLPTFLSQMRHHRREQLNKDDPGLADRPCKIV